MIRSYYGKLRRRIERLEAKRRAKPEPPVYLEAVDQDGKPWNVAGPDRDWFREEEDQAGGPAPAPSPTGESADQDRAADEPEQTSQRETPQLDLPPFGHNQRTGESDAAIAHSE